MKTFIIFGIVFAALQVVDSSVIKQPVEQKAPDLLPPLKSHVDPLAFEQFAESDARRWYTMAKDEIHAKIKAKPPRNRRAKNAIIFLGDGYGVSSITASRILKGQLRGKSGEEESLELDRFPYSAMIKTYNIDKQVPDSAGTATAYLTGVKGNYATIGVNSQVVLNEMDCRLVEESRVASILEWAQRAGKATGIVSTARVTHASPAGAYAHTQNRDFEGVIPDNINGQFFKNRAQCKDIAAQLVDLEPGLNFKVILGGGRAQFIPRNSFDPKGQLGPNGVLTPVPGKRTDGRNLIDDWQSRQRTAGHRFQYVNNTQGLRSVDIERTDYLMGLFNHSHMEYDYLRDKGNNGEPSLTEMTQTAIRMLKKERNGFVLFVEGARIDHAHHSGEANTALSEAIAFDSAIRAAIDMTDIDDTFIIVTADHSHTLTMNGYPDRGNPISGFGGVDSNGNPYTTLMYTNGPGYRDGSAQLALIKNQNTADMRFKQAATVPLIPDSNHGGEDVVAYARGGAWSWLMSGTHEQSYIPHVIAHALCIGQFTHEPHCFGRYFPFPRPHILSTQLNSTGDALSYKDTKAPVPAETRVEPEVKIPEVETKLREKEVKKQELEVVAVIENHDSDELTPVVNVPEKVGLYSSHISSQVQNQMGTKYKEYSVI